MLPRLPADLRTPAYVLDEAALATVRQLRFEPAKLPAKPNDRAVNVSAVVQYNFRKEEKAK